VIGILYSPVHRLRWAEMACDQAGKASSVTSTCLVSSRLAIHRRIYPHTPQPLNLNFEDFNTKALQKKPDIRDNSSIFYDMGSF